MTARHHHYLSQCYLKGFTKGKAKKSKLTVVDISQRKIFETIPRNVGGIRDFNRIEIDGLDPNILESALSDFEGVVATSLKRLSETGDFFGQTKNSILHLVALLAVRSPERREHMRTIRAQIAEVAMGVMLDSKDMWETHAEKIKAGGDNHDAVSASYEEAKRFYESKEYEIIVSRESHIRSEMIQVDAIVALLLKRNWQVLKASDNAGPFITSDSPVILSWCEPDSIPLMYRHSPGFGLRGTEVYFPISQDVALLGRFDGLDNVLNASRELVAILNSKMLCNLKKQIYFPRVGFEFYDDKKKIIVGNHILKYVRP
ncbi:MAG: hypothetical protein A2W44_12105 [Acinetobacter sp. RIFCSPHIGHO2_12_41_5]|nr:MAG: hypothetical protein A2W44_12105 [Acinetobacter sp. RIFCSPHIGHO2_12_41_5]